jgi:hypothetical protein
LVQEQERDLLEAIGKLENVLEGNNTIIIFSSIICFYEFIYKIWLFQMMMMMMMPRKMFKTSQGGQQMIVHLNNSRISL